MTGETPNPLDVIRRAIVGDGELEDWALHEEEAIAALAQVADLVEAAQGAHAHLPEQPNKAKRLLAAALVPFASRENTND